MPVIRAMCAECHAEVDLAPESVMLVVRPDGVSGSYGFVCPECHKYVMKPANERAVRLLVAGGVVPAGSQAPRVVEESLPVGWDDVLDFMLSIERDDWMDELGLVERNPNATQTGPNG